MSQPGLSGSENSLEEDLQVASPELAEADHQE